MNIVALDVALGEHWQLPIEFNRADGTDLNVTGASVVRWYLASEDKSIIYMTRNLGDGISLNDPVNGAITGAMLIVEPTHQLAMNPMPERGQYFHEVYVVLGDGTVSIQAQGPVTLRDSVRWYTLLP